MYLLNCTDVAIYKHGTLLIRLPFYFAMQGRSLGSGAALTFYAKEIIELKQGYTMKIALKMSNIKRLTARDRF